MVLMDVTARPTLSNERHSLRLCGHGNITIYHRGSWNSRLWVGGSVLILVSGAIDGSLLSCLCAGVENLVPLSDKLSSSFTELKLAVVVRNVRRFELRDLLHDLANLGVL